MDSKVNGLQKKSGLGQKTKKMEILKENLRSFNIILDNLYSKDIQDVSKTLNGLEKAKLQLTIAYCIASSYHLLLKCNGVSNNSHAIYSEISKIQVLINSARKIEGGNIKDGRTVRINQFALKRILKQQLSPNENVEDTFQELSQKKKKYNN
jgi:hypothetical protein